ncbi:hypothetical protein AYL99_01158 [Fonsecaea erecta]|uniref:Uncharacterized protein n=1 Tax=Fonsecaea erecta TaxID=1367422 RepID=A0A179A0Q2_9EURO|nr:hypothetical protein AYL99_01158 [Fonsecaea erecta]OAP65186.1 hypothetical protein AYL99_01158 [Fonsecaea erecta]
MSVVKFTAPKTFQTTHVIENVGQLSGESTALLLQHYERRDGERRRNSTANMSQALNKKARTSTERADFNFAKFVQIPSMCCLLTMTARMTNKG